MDGEINICKNLGVARTLAKAATLLILPEALGVQGSVDNGATQLILLKVLNLLGTKPSSSRSFSSILSFAII